MARTKRGLPAPLGAGPPVVLQLEARCNGVAARDSAPRYGFKAGLTLPLVDADAAVVDDVATLTCGKRLLLGRAEDGDSETAMHRMLNLALLGVTAILGRDDFASEEDRSDSREAIGRWDDRIQFLFHRPSTYHARAHDEVGEQGMVLFISSSRVSGGPASRVQGVSVIVLGSCRGTRSLCVA